MKIKVRMAIMSHLSDAQESACDEKLRQRKINFVKLLIFNYKNIDRQVSEETLNKLWDSMK